VIQIHEGKESNHCIISWILLRNVADHLQKSHLQAFFYVLLTVHLSTILVINQLNAQNLVL